MARVTVEDCLDHVENRFKLVLLASKRARQLSMGTEPLVEWENDKPTVVALREIEEGLVDEEMMEAALAKPVEDDLPFDEDDLAAALHAEISRELTQPAPEGQSTNIQQSDEQSANPFASTVSSEEPSQEEAPATAQPAPTMEELLAKELGATTETAPEANPFSENTEAQDTSADSTPQFGIPTIPDSSNNGD